MTEEERLRLAERQLRLEVTCVETGVAAFRRALAEKDLTTTPAGIRATGEMAASFLPAVESLHKEAVAGLSHLQQARKPEWWWAIGLLSPDKLAVITVRMTLSYIASRSAEARLFALCRRVARAVKHEIELEMWRQAETKTAKAEERPSLYDILLSRLPKGKDIDERMFRRWRKKIADIQTLEWSANVEAHVGLALVTLMVEHGGGWLAIKSVWVKGKRERFVVITEEGQEAIKDIHLQHELLNPEYMPMVCPPVPWRRTEI